MMHRILIGLLLCFILPHSASAQTPVLIQGQIIDAESGATLAAANLEIEGTYSGTTTNSDGEFALTFEEVPSTVIVSYIGYQSARLQIDNTSPDWLEIALQPVVYELEPMVITDEDPAVSIMRKVIEKKQVWRAKLKTYVADTYSRGTLENDSGIVAISEATSTLHWDKERGSKEVVLSRQQTSNLETNDNFAFASFVANFYDDDIELMDYQIIGPTHPDALKHYRFKLVSRRLRDDQTVYDIDVSPAGKLQPTLVGRISVLDEEYAIIDVDLRPGPSVLFPPPIQSFNLTYQQQFSNFGQEFWLPVDMHTRGSIKIGILGLSFPAFEYQRIVRFNDYDINIALPDSLYDDDRFIVIDSTTVAEDTLLTDQSGRIPLSAKEELAYNEIDTTMTIDKAFKPTGPLARFVDVEDGNESDTTSGFFSRYFSLNPEIWYNRVDGFHLGGYVTVDAGGRVDLTLGTGYGQALERWHFKAGADLILHKRQQISMSTEYSSGSATRFSSDTYHPTLTSLRTVFGSADYFDYYWRESLDIYVRKHLRWAGFSGKIGFKRENSESLQKNTDAALFDDNVLHRENPVVDAGALRSLYASAQIGHDYIPWGPVGQNRFSVSVEHSAPDILDSRFDFTKLDLSLDLNIPTFLRRRMLPNSLNVHLVAGTSWGNLPRQRFGILDGNAAAFQPFGVFRTRAGIPYEGEEYAALYWEHNFRTVPLELLGLRTLANKGIGIILHGAVGRTWIDDQRIRNSNTEFLYTTTVHHEIGLSINNLFSLFRIDFTQRLDESDFWIGFGFARFF